MGATWEFDRLGRREDSQFLTRYILAKYNQDENAGSFVLNLNAEWGLGKTYFLENWGRDLVAAGYPVVYFNAWENDFPEPPLAALIAEMHEKLSALLSAAPRARRLLDEVFQEAGRQIAPPEKTHLAFKQTRQAFKTSLAALIAHIGRAMKSWNLPVFIFIDELDRCRPQYAVELLENINHIFSANGIYFVIATDSDQLACSIQSIYGANFDAGRFLKRFFDQEYTLAEPENYRFSEYLFQRYKLEDGERFFSPLSRKYRVTGSIHADLFALSARYFRLSLRDQEQVCAMLKATRLTWAGGRRIHLAFLLFLFMLRQRSSAVFDEFIHAKIPSGRTGCMDKPAYRALIDDRVILRTSKAMSDGFHTPEEKEPFENMLRLYAEYSEKTQPQILESAASSLEAYSAIREELLAGMPEQYNPETPPRHELGRYPDIVRKVSNLSRQ